MISATTLEICTGAEGGPGAKVPKMPNGEREEESHSPLSIRA